MLFKQYKSNKDTLIVNLWINQSRELDIIGGDLNCYHRFNRIGECSCGATQCVWGEEQDIISFYRNTLAFTIMNSHFNNIIIISTKIIPTEYNYSNWKDLFSIKRRFNMYSTKDKKFLNFFTKDKILTNDKIMIIDYNYNNYLRNEFKDVLFVNPSVKDLKYTNFLFDNINSEIDINKFIIK